MFFFGRKRRQEKADIQHNLVLASNLLSKVLGWEQVSRGNRSIFDLSRSVLSLSRAVERTTMTTRMEQPVSTTQEPKPASKPKTVRKSTEKKPLRKRTKA